MHPDQHPQHPTPFLRAGLCALLCAALAACAGVGERYPSAEQAREQGREAEVEGYTYGHGTGGTPEEARQSALAEIAGEVVVAVRAQQREVFRSLRRRGELPEDETELETDLELTSTIASLTHVELEGAELDAEEQIDGGWYVRMRIPSRRMERLRERARRNAPALAQFELVDNLPDGEPGRRFRLALRGMETAQRTGVSDERLFTPSIGETTFGSYFEEAARTAARQMRALPEVEDNRVRFAIVDRETLQPQPGLAVRVGGEELVTNADGWTGTRDVRDMPRETRITIVGERRAAQRFSESDRLIETHHPDDWRRPNGATLYVHSSPAGAILQIEGRQYEAPARVSVQPGRTYHVLYYGTDEYREKRVEVTVPEGSPAGFVTARLTERSYGYVELSADGDARIRLSGPSGTLTESEIRRPLETARYELEVTRRNGGRRYQEIEDEIVLRRDETVRRRYAEPRDREPFYYGWRYGVSLFSAGGEPGDDYRLPWFDGEERGFGALTDGGGGPAGGPEVQSVSHSSLNALVGVQGQYFADRVPATVSGGAAYGVNRYEIDFDDGRTAEEDLATTRLTLGAGIWQALFGGDAVGWLTANHAWDSVRWTDRQGAASGLSGTRVQNDYAFVELGVHADSYSASLRVADSDGPGPMLVLSMGAAVMERGFNHPARTRARDGIHYNVDGSR